MRSGIHWEKGPTDKSQLEDNDDGGGGEGSTGRCFGKLSEKCRGVGIHWKPPSQLEASSPEKLFEQKIPNNFGEIISNAKSCEKVLSQKFNELEEECRRKDELIKELEKKVEEEEATIIDLENEQSWRKRLQSSESPKTIPSKTDCHLCNFEADNRRVLLEHIEDFHRGENVGKVQLEGTRCPICGLSFGDEGNVERHMERIHNIQSLEEKSKTVAAKKQFSGLVKCNYCSFQIKVVTTLKYIFTSHYELRSENLPQKTPR